jgi:hypothetical protein
VGTHNGSFHCDEALGCFLIRLTSQFSGADVVRTRDSQVCLLVPGLDWPAISPQIMSERISWLLFRRCYGIHAKIRKSYERFRLESGLDILILLLFRLILLY